MSFSRIKYREIEAWVRLVTVAPTPMEIRLLMEIDEVLASIYFPAEVPPETREDIALGIKSGFRAMIAKGKDKP